MEKAEKEKLALALLNMINQKREEIKNLASEIIELESNPQNVVRIKQNILRVINAVNSFSPEDFVSYSVKVKADLIFGLFQLDDNNESALPHDWHDDIVPNLEEFCLRANSWNPLEIDLSKSPRIIINLPKNLNILSIVNYLKGKS
jgi:hypothetical protein